jgi:STE24 endopeptidase
MPVDNIYVIDASTKTTQVNAYVTSFGQAQRMVLYDTLLEGYPLDQVEVVVSHELGHWYYQHLLWGTIGASAAGWLGLFALRWLLDRSWQSLGWQSAADVAGLPYLLAILAIVTGLSLPLQNGISRYAEGQADAFALTTSQNPTAAVTFFEQLAEQNLSLVKPPAWEVFLFYTHPPIAARIQRAESFQTQQQTQ